MESQEALPVIPSEIRKRKVDLHIRVPEEYGSSKKTLPTNAQAIQLRRIAREKNIDLWVDGQLYPFDPPLRANPPFHNISSFLQFVGDGEQGLLGYCKRLTTVGAWQNHMLFSQLQATQSVLVQCQDELKTSSEKIGEVLKEIEKKNAKIIKLEDTIKRLKATPNGARERKKSLSSIETLALKGGARKKRIRATKSFLQEICGSNDETWRDIVKEILAPEDILSIISDGRHPKIRKAVVAKVVSEITSCIDSQSIQHACDDAGISMKGYHAIRQVIKDAFLRQGIGGSLFPTLKLIQSVKRINNDDVQQAIGEYFHIEDKLTLDMGSKKKNKTATIFEYNAYNNIFVNVEILQKAMVKFYNLPSEVLGSTLSFVLKLDECQIVKGRRLERMSITLMNEAMACAFNKNSVPSFRVQSEKEVCVRKI